MSKFYGEEWQEIITREESKLKGRTVDWNRVREMLNAKFASSETKNDLLYENLFFTTARIILPSIYFNNPYITGSPGRSNVPLAFVRIVELLLNHQFDTMGVEDEVGDCIYDALFTPLGVMKLGFGPALDTGSERTELNDFFAKDIRENINWNSDDRITEEDPFVLRTSSRRFLIDPTCTKLENARWICFKILKPLEEVKKNKTYSRRAIKGIEATHAISDPRYLNEADSPPSSTGQNSNEKINCVELYEIWNKVDNKLIVLDSYHVKNNDDMALREEDNPYNRVRNFPAEVLRFNPDPDQFYGQVDALQWEPMIEGLMNLITMQYTHVKRFHRKYVARRGIFQDGDVEKLTSGEDGVVCEIDGNPREDVAPLQDASISGDAYALRDYLKYSLNTMAGTSEERKGGGGKTKTATEASIIESQARVRESDRVKRVSKFTEKIARKLLALDQEFLSAERVSFLTGEPWVDPTSGLRFNLAQLWDQHSESILQAPVNVKVRVGSSAYVGKEVRTKQLLDFWNLTAKVIDPVTGQPVINHRALIERIGESLEIADLDRLLTPVGPVQMQPEMMGQGSGGSQPGMQPGRRMAGSGMGDILSGIQNLGIGRQANPTDQSS